MREGQCWVSLRSTQLTRFRLHHFGRVRGNGAWAPKDWLSNGLIDIGAPIEDEGVSERGALVDFVSGLSTKGPPIGRVGGKGTEEV